MSATETSLTGNVSNFTEPKTEFIPLTPNESVTLQGALGFIQQVKNENEVRAVNANNQFSAMLWEFANRHRVDLGAYEFNFEKQGFVKR